MANDIVHNIYPVASLGPVAVTAAVPGVGVDLKGYERSAVFLTVGAVTGTATPTVTFVLEESDDNAAFTLVAPMDLIGGPNSLVANTASVGATLTRDYIGSRRYVRASCSAVSGTTPSAMVSGVIARGRPRHVGNIV